MLPSHHEAAPMVYAEAMLLGVPVLTTDTCSAEELVSEQGFVCGQSQQEIYDAIKTLLNDKQKVYDKKDDKQTWFEKIKALCPELGFCDNMKEYKKNPEAYKGNVADVSGIIRVAITTRRNSPDLYEIMNLLGDKEVKNRINKAIDLLK